MRKVLGLIFLFSSFSLYAGSEYVFRHITVNEGLSHSDVLSVTQDTMGYVWLATNNGLNRFDGYEIKTYKKKGDSPNSLPDNRLKTLFYSSRNHLWIGMEKGGVCLYNPLKDNFIRIIDERAAITVTAIREGPTGDIWAATERNGVYIIKEESGELNFSIAHVFDGDAQITDFEFFENGALVGTINGLYYLDGEAFSFSQWKKPFPKEEIFCIYRADSSEYWISSSSGLYRYFKQRDQWDMTRLNISSAEDEGEKLQIQTVFKDADGIIWAGSLSSGVFILNENAVTGKEQAINIVKQEGKEIGLNNDKINCVYEDAFNTIWLGASGGGANYYDKLRKPFYHIYKEPGKQNSLPNNYISAVFERSPEELWIGTRDGLSVYRFTTDEYINYRRDENDSSSLSGNHVSCIYQDSSGRIWVGSRTNGLNLARFEGEDLKFTRINAENSDLSGNDVIGIAEDQFGRIWVGSFTKGISIIDPESMSISSADHTPERLPAISSRLITYLYKDPYAPVMWVGTRDKGVVRVQVAAHDRYDTVGINLVDKETASGSNYAWPIVAAAPNEIYVGAIGGGLYRITFTYSDYRIHRYDEEDGLPDSDVETLIVDQNGDVWIGGKGLAKFNPETQKIVVYDVRDGLQSNSFKIGAACNGRNGRLYFGGINGLNYFDFSKIASNPVPPKVRISNFKIFNKDILIDKKVNDRILLTRAPVLTDRILLKDNEYDFTIGFTGIHFASPSKNRYRYKLEGYNDDWIEVGGDVRWAAFSNLKAGSYNFLVDAANPDGLWSNQPARLNIIISPPWWKTWWAYTGYIGAFFGLMVGYQYLAKKQYDLKNELAIAEKERAYNESQMMFFTNIAHEIRTPLTLIHGPLEEIIESGFRTPDYKTKIFYMHRSAQRLLSLMNQLLNFRKLETGNMKLAVSSGNVAAFTREIFLFFTLKAEELKIDYRFESKEGDVPLYFDRGKLEIVIANLLSNAFKYAKSRIQVKIDYKGSCNREAVYYPDGTLKDNYVLITVEDDGPGMPSEECEKIFDRYYQAATINSLHVAGSGIGLSLAKGIVELHKGSIQVESQFDQGSTFLVRLPFGRNVFPAEVLPVNSEAPSYEKAGTRPLRIDEPAPKRLSPVPASAEAKDQITKVYQILIVEDSEDVRSYLLHILSQDYKTFGAANGEEGLRIARERLPDLIVTDVMMPVMDGIEMCRLLKKDEELSHIPIIILTARTSSVYELEGLETGALDYICKPFSVNLLKAKIKNYVLIREQLKDFYKSNIRLQTQPAGVNLKDEKFLTDAIRLVEENIGNSFVTVQFLSDNMAMSQSTFYRRLKELTGRSVVEFIRDVRLKAAGKLLEEGSNVSQAAYKSGFNDLKYFRKCFKEQFGVNPSDYGKKEIKR